MSLICIPYTKARALYRIYHQTALIQRNSIENKQLNAVKNQIVVSSQYLFSYFIPSTYVLYQVLHFIQKQSFNLSRYASKYSIKTNFLSNEHRPHATNNTTISCFCVVFSRLVLIARGGLLYYFYTLSDGLISSSF